MKASNFEEHRVRVHGSKIPVLHAAGTRESQSSSSTEREATAVTGFGPPRHCPPITAHSPRISSALVKALATMPGTPSTPSGSSSST